ncbi:MAG: hypothetical protein JSS86_18020 [Cyanobacteria bacterium SZAS LIN-2]|nr:hypothetical protein [Cyanobacteria bacterium SZAS LIN-2]
MSRPAAIVLGYALLGTVGLSAAEAATPADKRSEWIVSNIHVGSATFVYSLSEKAVRIENTGNGGIVVSKAPTWRVSCYRPGDKLEYSSELKKFDASAIFSFVPRHNAPLFPASSLVVGSETIKGLKCRRITLPDQKVVWTVADLKSAPQVSEVVSRYFSNVNVGQVPIRIMNPPLTPLELKKVAASAKSGKSTVPWMNFKSLTFNPHQRLVTDLVSWKKVPYKDSDFDYPVGYKQTRDIKDVIFSASNRQELMELLDGR